MSITRRIAALLGGAGAIGFCAGASAQGLDLRDKIIGFETTYAQETRDLVRNTTDRGAPDQSETWISAVAGKIAWVGNTAACGHSLVYVPGRSFAGKNECKPKRTGTASQWIERSSNAAYRTTAAVAGNVVTLKGEMAGTYLYRSSNCQRWESAQKTNFKVVQSLKIRIAGDRCEVLEFSEVEEEDVVGEMRYADGRVVPRHEIRRTTRTLAPSRACKIERRSEQGPGQPLRDPYAPC